MQDWIHPQFGDIMLRCATAIICGILVGIERAYRAKPAGVRTHMLISLGSCLFMAISTLVAEQSRQAGFLTADPARIAAQVVSGVGFLGAGALIRNNGLVRGMTSAATIWCMAAIGLAAGAGLLLIAFASTVSIIVILQIFDVLEHALRARRARLMSLEVIMQKNSKPHAVRKLLRKRNMMPTHERINKVLGEVHYLANIYLDGRREEQLTVAIQQQEGVLDVLILQRGESPEL